MCRRRRDSSSFAVANSGSSGNKRTCRPVRAGGPSRAPPVRLARLAAGLIRDFPAGAPVLLRRAALGRTLRLVRYVERERPDILFANLDAGRISGVFRPTPRPAHSRATRFPAHRADRAQYREARDQAYEAAADAVPGSRACGGGLARRCGERLCRDWRTGREDNADLQPHLHAGHRPARGGDALAHPWFGDDGPPVILGAGRLAPQKDFPTLIEAFRRVSAARACRLVILGEGRLRPQLEGQVRALGLEDWVSLPGWTENPYAFMSRAALFVLSSRHEGFPGVLVEALACGCPVVSTDCPAGPSEILEDPGLLAPVGDPEALSRIMRRALDRPVDKAALRARAARFSVERAVNEYDKLIARIAVRQEGNG